MVDLAVSLLLSCSHASANFCVNPPPLMSVHVRSLTQKVTIGTPRLHPPHAIPDCIAVGLSAATFPLKGKMPGWDALSYGYHSDDGGAFHDAGSMLFK